jgi:hypothetical protein
MSRKNKRAIRKNIINCWIPQAIGSSMSLERFLKLSTHSQKNKEQTYHPQVFGPFSLSRYMIHFCDNFQTTRSNKLIFLGIVDQAEIYPPTKKRTF